MAKTKAKDKKESELTWKDFEIGSICTEPGSSTQYLTGGWRSQRPISDLSKCNQCGFCYIFCPEGCVEQQADGYFKANLDYCKGCGICATECPRGVIKMVEEE